MLVHLLPLWPAGTTHSLELAAIRVKGPLRNLGFFDLKIRFQELSSNFLESKHTGVHRRFFAEPLYLTNFTAAINCNML